MLLTKEENLPNDYLLRSMQDSLKNSTYMPPIKSSDKFSKHFLSPTQFQSAKRLAPFSYNHTPKRDYNPVKLEPFGSPFSTLADKQSEIKMNLDRFKNLSATLKPKMNIHIPNKSMKNGNFFDTESKSSKDNENNVRKQPADPLNTFQTFMNRLNKLQINSILPNSEPIRFSDKAHGIVKGFSVCTNQGLVRNYNEDRVSIILNISRPPNKPAHEYWPNCSMFGVFDGHGGSKCAEFLRNNLHQFIIQNQNFPWNPQEALKEAFEDADREFLENVLIESEEGKYDKSGSCAIIVMIIDDTCYVCNVGDSRAIISQNFGNSCYALSRDHKPCDKAEQKRIVDAGGKVYQNFPVNMAGKRMDMDPKSNPLGLQVPFRILPGRLSVSRAFGDIEAKLTRFGGNPNVLIAKPEITTLKITKDHDFIFLASDGVFDKLSNEEIINTAWGGWTNKQDQNIHLVLRNGVENIIKESLLKKSLDNVTGILIGFSHLEHFFDGFDAPKKESNRRVEYLEELKHEYIKLNRDIPLQTQTPLRNHVGSINIPNMLSENSESMKTRTSSRGHGFQPKSPNEPFSLSKYMEINMRRGSDGLPRLNQYKSTKGF